jgi:hypothetical protein
MSKRYRTVFISTFQMILKCECSNKSKKNNFNNTNYYFSNINNNNNNNNMMMKYQASNVYFSATNKNNSVRFNSINNIAKAKINI